MHTIGPWRVEFWPEQNGWGIAGYRGSGWVALVAPQGPSDGRNPTEESNARLLASAPELLAALKLLAEYSEKSLVGLGQGNGGMVNGCIAARAAIAKAEGE